MRVRGDTHDDRYELTWISRASSWLHEPWVTVRTPYQVTQPLGVEECTSEITIHSVERVEVAECEDDGGNVEPGKLCGETLGPTNVGEQLATWDVR